MTLIPEPEIHLTSWQRFRNRLADRLSVPIEPHYSESTWIRTFEAPSNRDGLKFNLTVRFTAKNFEGSGDIKLIRALAAAEVQQRCSAISEGLALSSSHQLQFQLNAELPHEQEIPGRNITVSAQCTAVGVDAAQLELVTETEKTVLEQQLIAQKMEFIDKVMNGPRSSTIWWLAEHPEQIDKLQERTDLFIDVDQKLEVNESMVSRLGEGRSCLRVMAKFLNRNGDEAVYAVASALLRLFKDYDDHELQAEAQRILGMAPGPN